MVSAHSVRSRTITTMTGPVRVRRAYHYCRACRRGWHPADQALGLGRQTTSMAVDKAVTAAAREMPFARAAGLLQEITGEMVVAARTADRIAKRSGAAARALIEADTARVACAGPGAYRRRWDPGATAYVFADGTGLPMVPTQTAGRPGKQPDGSAKTREVKIGRLSTQTRCDRHGQPVLDPDSTSYVATFNQAEGFTCDIAAEAVRRDFARAPRLAVIADGATWIWNLADKLWPHATQIVDYYHAAEHVHDLAKLLRPHLGQPGPDPEEFTDKLKDHLYHGRIQALATMARAVPLPDQDTKDQVATALGYFTKNWFRMRYAQFRAQNLCIGSGAVESACKNLAEARAAQSGMRWTINGADPILALRALHRSTHQAPGDQTSRYNQIWERTIPKTTHPTPA
ncbi:MAG: ISKra4 family transposase [Bifidobacteriaceae bacterium]|nr:ISKra4 family transposase [Bifidobacteriaceae bacterium]